ncbi:MAG TPA: hypothetical protein PK886_01785 [Candidatus Paceibacterota bacterium]|nr:hypothetical protein [Candidatus Paceibacterota bacterium]
MSQNLSTGTQILTSNLEKDTLDSLKGAIRKYRRNDKTGPALYELITTLKEHLIASGKKIADFAFEDQEVQNLLLKLRATDSEIKKIKGHWETPKGNFFT